jgi:hypothetical protein
MQDAYIQHDETLQKLHKASKLIVPEGQTLQLYQN